MKAAIYSRKSVFTGKGESVENQVNLCREYAEKSLHKIDEFLVYEDEGFSGGNTNRPEFQNMLKDARNKKFDILICYRLDRISRNVADFSSTLELLQENNIAFISIKEQFDTSTPIGKAMVYIASVFAQLERETIAERIKDNMLELSKSGRWLGGQCPLGFESEQISFIDYDYNERTLFKLKSISDEINIVKLIYDKFCETASVYKVLKYLLSLKIKGKNGGEFASVTVSEILRNPVYVISDDMVLKYLHKKGIQTSGEANGNGILIYNKKNSKNRTKEVSEWIAAVSKHKGIISSDKWLQVQTLLDNNSKKKHPKQGISKRALLSGILKCARCGSPMRISYGRVKKDINCDSNSTERIFYYTCTMKAHSGKTRCDNPNIRGDYLEQQLLKKLFNVNISLVIEELEKLKKASAKSETKDFFTAAAIKNLEIKKNEMNILISQLSNITSSVALEFIIRKINALGDEIKNLEIHLQESQIENKSERLSIVDISILLNSIKEFPELFDKINQLSSKSQANGEASENRIIRLKRYLIETAVKNILVDGETKKVIVELRNN